MTADDILDVVLTVAISLVLMISIFQNGQALVKDNLGGFDTQIEKTARKTESTITIEPKEISYADVVYMLLNADKYCPEPKRLNVLGLGIEFNDELFKNKEEALNAVLTKLDTNKQYKYKYTEGGWEIYE